MKVCCFTNARDEYFNLPIWAKYYTNQFGPENCIILDHGSEEAALRNTHGASIIRLPISEFDDVRRAQAVRHFAESMLKYYDAIVYTDCDEILVADPRKYSGLLEMISKMESDSVTAIGLNVIHDTRTEDPIVDGRSILSQRKYVQFTSPMCKTLISKNPIIWGGGFHSSSHPVSFADLYLFHLRAVDFGESLKRLSITRKLTWADKNAGLHQRRENASLFELFGYYSQWPKTEDFSEVEKFKDDVRNGVVKNPHDHLFYTPLNINVNKLVEIPLWFGEPF